MALARVILHVGPPRTGTTSIQAMLAACQGRLLGYGIYYPPTQPESAEGQPSLAWDILAATGKTVARLSQARVSWEEAWEGAERAGAHTLLVSSEDFSSDAFDRTAFLELGRRLMRVPVDVVFALRDPRRLVPSIWSHSVRWGIGCGEELLSLPEAAPLILRRRDVRVIEYLATLQELVQPQRINLFTIPRNMDPSLVAQRFAHACGFPGEAIADILTRADSLHPSTHNAALSLKSLLVLLEINRAMAGTRSSNSIEVRRRLLEVIQKDAVGDTPQRAALVGDSRAAAEDLGFSIVRWAEARSASVYGDLGDVWDQGSNDELDSAGMPSQTEAEISSAALQYLADTASEMQNTIADLQNGREFWREQARNWEVQCMELARSWSWRLTAPLRLAGPFRSMLRRSRTP